MEISFRNYRNSFLKPSQVLSKLDRETSQNDGQQNNKKTDPPNRQKVSIWPPNWVLRGGSSSPFSTLFRLRASLVHLWDAPGSQTGPKTSPESFWDPSRASVFSDFYTIWVPPCLCMGMCLCVWDWWKALAYYCRWVIRSTLGLSSQRRACLGSSPDPFNATQMPPRGINK